MSLEWYAYAPEQPESSQINAHGNAIEKKGTTMTKIYIYIYTGNHKENTLTEPKCLWAKQIYTKHTKKTHTQMYWTLFTFVAY